MGVTSIAKDRGRAFGIAIALAASAALVANPAAFGAGDPVATGNFKLKLGGAFKAQLNANGVKMKPKSLKFKSGSLDPTTGGGSLELKKKLTFKKGNKKLVYSKLRVKLGANGKKGNIRGSKGKIFQLKGGKLARNGFGADLTGVKVKFLKSAAKKINKALDLSSLHQGSAGKVSFAEQPETVEVLGGTATTTGATRPSPAPPFGEPGPYPAAVKLALGHCVNGSSTGTTGFAGIQPISPATQPGGPGTTISLPVVGGTISPTADSGNVQQSGGVKLVKNLTINGNAMGFGDCTNGGGAGTPYPGELLQTDQVVRLGEKDVQSTVTIAGAPPGFPLSGNIGTAIGQSLDQTSTVVSADPATKTITTTGTLVKITEASATTLNGVFPCVNNVVLPIGNPCSDASSPNTAILKGGDLFGTSTLTVTVR